MQLPVEWVYAIFAAMVGVLGWLLPTPKQWADGHSKRMQALEDRQLQMMEKQHVLERAQIESNTRLTTEMRALAGVIRELKLTIADANKRHQHEQRD